MGEIVSVKRFAIHDGDGIRTTLFLKGCPLKCKWCHNPESILCKSQIAYYEEKCINCGECSVVCEAHSMKNSKHTFERSLCIGCGKCAEVCMGEALKFYGKEMRIDELLPKLLEDKIFYENSGGGVTISGGEPLMQPDFTAEILQSLKEAGINTAVDTCGFASKEAMDKVIPFTDTFLYDIKAYDEQLHIDCTGISNIIILDNIKYLNERKIPIEVRIPYIPTINSDQIKKIGKFLSGLKMVKNVKVLPYHNYASSKYKALGMQYKLDAVVKPLPEEIDESLACLKSFGLHAMNGGNK